MRLTHIKINVCLFLFVLLVVGLLEVTTLIFTTFFLVSCILAAIPLQSSTYHWEPFYSIIFIHTSLILVINQNESDGRS